MDRAYANALKKKEELQREMEAVDAFLDMYQRFQGIYEQEKASNSPASTEDSFVKDGFGRNVRVLRPPEIADLAERVIREANQPLTRAEIVSRIERGGHVLNSEDKPRYVGTILWRQKERFTNIPGQGYVLADMASAQQNLVDMIDRTTSEEEADREKAEGVFD